MPSSMPPLVPPDSGGSPSWGNGYASSLPAVGLAGLAQGFTHGLEIGHDWATQGRQQDLENMRFQNQDAWRQEQLAQQLALRSQQEKQQAEFQQGQIQNRKDMLDFMKSQADRVGTPIYDDAGTIVGYQTGKGGIVKPAGAGKAGADQKALNAAAGAYSAMDNYQSLANSFLPDSAAAAAIKSPLEWLRSKAMQTSPENNLADKSGQAATLYAAAVNAGGGGRMSEAEIENMAKAMGGHGIGETKGNISQKIEQMKNDLAAKSGLSRQAIDDYIAKTKNGGGGNSAAGGAAHKIPDGRVLVVGPNGSQYHLPKGQLAEAIKQGYRQP